MNSADTASFCATTFSQEKARLLFTDRFMAGQLALALDYRFRWLATVVVAVLKLLSPDIRTAETN